jgi:hypothetical protein
MIVFDENDHQQHLMTAVAAWYRGRVVSITILRPGTIIKDEAMPAVLQQVKQPTFVTTNVFDFWRRVAAHPQYCIVCFPLPNERLNELPQRLRQLLRLPEFKTKAARMGKVILVSRQQIQYYVFGDKQIRRCAWPS